MSTDRKRRSDAGFLSVELMVAVGLSLIFLVFLVNFIFIQYGKGVVRAAADEAARAGSRVDATEVVCQQRATSIMDSLGAMATNPKITCAVDEANNTVSATVTAEFEPWMPWIPVITANATGTSVKEVAPPL